MGVPICVELWLAPLALASSAVSQPGKREGDELICSVVQRGGTVASVLLDFSQRSAVCSESVAQISSPLLFPSL